MKFLFVLIFTFSGVFAFSQAPLKDFYLKRNLKQNDQQYQFSVLDEDKHGVWFYDKHKFYFWYRAQHVISTQGESSGVLLHGAFEAFYENKQLSEKGYFKKGLKNGEWLYWRNDGTLITTEKWSNGDLKVLKRYTTDGQLSTTTKFKFGKVYSEFGDSVSVISRNGKREKRTIYEDGRVVKSETLSCGRLHGTVKEYEDGKLLTKTRYKKGEPVTKRAKEPSESNAPTEEKEKKTLKERLKRKEKSEKEPKEKKSKEERPEKIKTPKEPKTPKEKKPKKESKKSEETPIKD